MGQKIYANKKIEVENKELHQMLKVINNSCDECHGILIKCFNNLLRAYLEVDNLLCTRFMNDNSGRFTVYLFPDILKVDKMLYTQREDEYGIYIWIE